MNATADALFSRSVERIEGAYTTLGHSLGWRFLSVSKSVLTRDPQILLLTANPGGSSIPPDHPTGSCEHGCAYTSESWGTSPRGAHKLQVQVQRLFDALALHVPSKTTGTDLLEESLIGAFIPFRSPRLALLHRPADSLEFAKELWGDVLKNLRPRLQIAIDPEAYRGIHHVCIAAGGKRIASERLQTGWGNINAEIDEFRFPDHCVMTLRLPHLSTFQLFSRAECAPCLEIIISRASKHLLTRN